MTTPLILAYVGMAVMLTLSCTGSAIGVTMGGNTTIAALKKKPEIFGKSMLLCVLPSTQGLYGFAAFFLMLSSLGGMEDASQVLTMNQGLAMCAAGLALGFVGLWSHKRLHRVWFHPSVQSLFSSISRTANNCA